MKPYTYLLLNAGTILFPLLLSFDRKVAFYRGWKRLFPAIGIVAAFFIVWDHYFTASGVWHFNKEYLTGFFLWDLPVEEWLFFLTTPYACVFIYEVVRTYWKLEQWAMPGRWISLLAAIAMLLTAAFHAGQAYTAAAFGLGGLLLLYFARMQRPDTGAFWAAYALHLIPFFIINGVLTSLPVVEYNDAENTGLRLYTVPIEDTAYSLVLFLGTTLLYQRLRLVGVRRLSEL